jgi:hypothetical protein
VRACSPSRRATSSPRASGRSRWIAWSVEALLCGATPRPSRH